MPVVLLLTPKMISCDGLVHTMMFPIIFLVIGFHLHQSTSCPSFNTGNITNLQVEENSALTFNFSVRYDTVCDPNTTIFKVEIHQDKERAEVQWEPLCIFNHKNGTCIPPRVNSYTSSCSCSPETPLYAYTIRQIDGLQDRNWTLTGTLTNGKEFNRTVMIFVFEPLVISSLTVQSNNASISEDSPAIPNSTVNITCLWDKGKPGQSAVLKKDSVVLDVVKSTGPNDLNRVEHVIHNVQCYDTGMVSCEMAGAREHKTQMIIVKCDPKFGAGDISILATSELHTVPFPVTAYDRKIVACELLEYDSSNGTYGPEKVDCVSTASLTGSVPNLNLTIRLPHWVKKVGGRWRLDFTNYGGKGSVYFTIAEIRDEESHSSDLTAVIVSTCLVVVVAIVITVSVCHYKTSRNGDKIGAERRNRHNRTAVSQSFYRRSNVSVMITNDLYEGCDTTRTPVELGYTDVHDAIQQSRDGTPSTTRIDTSDNTTASVAVGVTARAEFGDIDEEDDDDGDYEVISPRRPVVPTGSQQHMHQQLPPTTLTPPKPCHSSEVTGDYADVE